MRNVLLIFVLDFLWLVLNVSFAVINRGTWIGWLFSAIVAWQVFVIVNAIKSSYE